MSQANALVVAIAQQRHMRQTKFFGQAEHVYQTNGKITQAQWYGNQAQIPEKTRRNK
jgi:hypothetical protein